MNLSRQLFSLLALVTVSGTSVTASDWPHWRGPQRNGIVREDSGWGSGRWPPDRPAWSINAGRGATSPLVVKDRVYVMGWKQGRDHLACLDAASGKELWSVSYPCREYGRQATGDQGLYGGPSSTPEYDPDTGYLYTLGTDGDLHCWDTGKEGHKVWGLNLHERYSVPRRPRIGRSGLRDYGYTSSPLVHGDWLLVEVGANEGNLMAFDKRTGKQVWASESRGPAGHNSGPVPMTVEGVPCVAVLTTLHLLVIRLDQGNEGKTVAQYPWSTDFANNIAGPAVHENHVLITAEYNHCAIVKLRISLQGATPVWKKSYSSKVCTPIIHKGHVYWAWRTLKCLDWETGELKWEGGSFGDPGSCIVTGDDRLIVWGANGRLVLAESAERSPRQYRELAVKDRVFSTHAWPHVVLSGGRLYCKDRQGNLHCYQISG